MKRLVFALKKSLYSLFAVALFVLIGCFNSVKVEAAAEKFKLQVDVYIGNSTTVAYSGYYDTFAEAFSFCGSYSSASKCAYTMVDNITENIPADLNKNHDVVLYVNNGSGTLSTGSVINVYNGFTIYGHTGSKIKGNSAGISAFNIHSGGVLNVYDRMLIQGYASATVPTVNVQSGGTLNVYEGIIKSISNNSAAYAVSSNGGVINAFNGLIESTYANPYAIYAAGSTTINIGKDPNTVSGSDPVHKNVIGYQSMVVRNSYSSSGTAVYDTGSSTINLYNGSVLGKTYAISCNGKYNANCIDAKRSDFTLTAETFGSKTVVGYEVVTDAATSVDYISIASALESCTAPCSIKLKTNIAEHGASFSKDTVLDLNDKIWYAINNQIGGTDVDFHVVNGTVKASEIDFQHQSDRDLTFNVEEEAFFYSYHNSYSSELYETVFEADDTIDYGSFSMFKASSTASGILTFDNVHVENLRLVYSSADDLSIIIYGGTFLQTSNAQNSYMFQTLGQTEFDIHGGSFDFTDAEGVAIVYNAGGNLRITWGVFTSGISVIENGGNGTLAISGGVFNSSSAIIKNGYTGALGSYGYAEISAGQFTGSGTSGEYLIYNGTARGDHSDMIICGGTFTFAGNNTISNYGNLTIQDNAIIENTGEGTAVTNYYNLYMYGGSIISNGNGVVVEEKNNGIEVVEGFFGGRVDNSDFDPTNTIITGGSIDAGIHGIYLKNYVGTWLDPWGDDRGWYEVNVTTIATLQVGNSDLRNKVDSSNPIVRGGTYGLRVDDGDYIFKFYNGSIGGKTDALNISYDENVNSSVKLRTDNTTAVVTQEGSYKVLKYKAFNVILTTNLNTTTHHENVREAITECNNTSNVTTCNIEFIDAVTEIGSDSIEVDSGKTVTVQLGNNNTWTFDTVLWVEGSLNIEGLDSNVRRNKILTSGKILTYGSGSVSLDSVYLSHTGQENSCSSACGVIYHTSTGSVVLSGRTYIMATNYNSPWNGIISTNTGTISSSNWTGAIHVNAVGIKNEAGVLNITSGEIIGDTTGVLNSSVREVILGGILTSNNIGVHNTSNGTITISATASINGDVAVQNDGTGTIDVHGGIGIYSLTNYGLVNSSTGTINVNAGAQIIVQNTAITNSGAGTITVSGTNISIHSEYMNVLNESTGDIDISGRYNSKVSIVNTSSLAGFAIYNDSTGSISLSYANITISGASSTAIENTDGGTVTGSFNIVSDGKGVSNSHSDGSVTMVSGTIETESTAIVNTGTFNMTSGTIKSNSETVVNTGNFNMNNGSLESSSGTVIINSTENNSTGNNSTGNVTISQGKIIGYYRGTEPAIINEGELTVGVDTPTASALPSIIGGIYGVASTGKFYFYNGSILGKTNAYNVSSLDDDNTSLSINIGEAIHDGITFESASYASIGMNGVNYGSIQAAVNACAGTCTITLSANVVENSVNFPASKIITIDLNGNTWTSTSGYHTVQSGGSLTIQGDGDIINEKSTSFSFNIAGSFTMNGTGMIKAYIKGSNSYSATWGVISNTGTTTINSGEVLAPSGVAIKNNGGTVNIGTTSVTNSNGEDINSLLQEKFGSSINAFLPSKWMDPNQVIVRGHVNAVYNVSGTFNFHNGSLYSANLSTFGSYTVAPYVGTVTKSSSYSLNPYVITDDATDTKYKKVAYGVIVLVDTVGYQELYFGSIQDAANYCKSSESSGYCDIAINAAIYENKVEFNNNITLYGETWYSDVGSHLIKGNLDINEGATICYTGASKIFTVNNYGILEFVGGRFIHSLTNILVESTGKVILNTANITIVTGIDVLSGGTLQINNGTINGAVNNKGTMTISGGSISNSETPVVNGSTGNLTISGGNITGGTVSNHLIQNSGTITINYISINVALANVIVNSGSITMLEGTIQSNYVAIVNNSSGVVTLGQSGTAITDAMIIGGEYAISNSGTFNFYGGSILGDNSLDAAYDGNTPVLLQDTSIAKDYTLYDGITYVRNYISVGVNIAVAKVVGSEIEVYFGNLVDAFGALDVSEYRILTLLKNTTACLELGHTILAIIDLNGYEWSCTSGSNLIIRSSGNNITFEDNSDGQTGKITGSGALIMDNSSSYDTYITFNSGTYASSGYAVMETYSNSGLMTINGGTFTAGEGIILGTTSIEINGGDLTSSGGTLQGEGEWVINGGSIVSTTAAAITMTVSAPLTINGGIIAGATYAVNRGTTFSFNFNGGTLYGMTSSSAGYTDAYYGTAVYTEDDTRALVKENSLHYYKSVGYYHYASFIAPSAKITYNSVTTYYSSLDNAVGGLNSSVSKTIVLLKDATHVTINNKLGVIDLNGFSISNDLDGSECLDCSTLSIYGASANITIIDSVGGGKITGTFAGLPVDSINQTGIISLTGGTLTILGGSVSIKQNGAAIFVYNATLNLGSSSDSIKSLPRVEGNDGYAVAVSSGTFNYYNGTLTAKHSVVEDYPTANVLYSYYVASGATFNRRGSEYTQLIERGGYDYYQTILMENVAQVGSTTYDTLEAALSAVSAGGTITLLKNITVLPITISKNVTINFGDYLINNYAYDSLRTITEYSAITISANVTFTQSEASESVNIEAYNENSYSISVSGTLTLQNVRINNLSSNGINIEQTGTVVVNSSVVNAANSYAFINNGTLSINNGEIFSTRIAINNLGVMTLSSGTITGDDRAVANSGTFNFNDGYLFGNLKYASAYSGNTPVVPTGKFIMNISENGYRKTYLIDNVVASIEYGGVTEYFGSLQAAVDSVQVGSPRIILLISNYEIEETVVISTSIAVTIDLNGRIWSTYESTYSLRITNDCAFVTIGGSVGEISGIIYNVGELAIGIDEDDEFEIYAIENEFDLCLDSGSIYGYVKNEGEDANFTIYGGEVNTATGYEGAAVVSSDGAYVTVAGGSVTTNLSYGIRLVNSGTVTISDGIVKGNIGISGTLSSGAQLTINGGAVIGKTYAIEVSTFNFYGGTLYANSSNSNTVVNAYSSNVVLNSGLYILTSSATYSGTFYYIVQVPGTAVASITYSSITRYYSTIQSAVDSVGNNVSRTIVLLTNVSGLATIESNAIITFNLNGKTWSGDSSGRSLNVSAISTTTSIVDSVGNGKITGSIENKGNILNIGNAGLKQITVGAINNIANTVNLINVIVNGKITNSGVLTMGSSSLSFDESVIVYYSTDYAIVNTGTFNFYGGVIYGKSTNATAYSNSGIITTQANEAITSVASTYLSVNYIKSYLVTAKVVVEDTSSYYVKISDAISQLAITPTASKTIKLLANISECVTASSQFTGTINLNNYTWSCATASTITFAVTNANSNVTITNGTISSSSYIVLQNKGTMSLSSSVSVGSTSTASWAIENHKTLNITNSTILNNGSMLLKNVGGTTNITTSTLTYTGSYTGINVEAGIVNINSGTISSKTAVIANGAELIINGGTLTSSINSSGNLTVNEGTITGNISVQEGTSAVYDGTINGTINLTGGTLSIKGGTVRSTTSYAVNVSGTAAATFEYVSGTLIGSAATNAYSYIISNANATFTCSGTEYTTKASNLYTTVVNSGVFKIGSTTYDTFAAALTAATNNSTIELVKNATILPVNINKNITLNLNGKYINNFAKDRALTTGNYDLFTISATVTMKNNAVNNTVLLTSYSQGARLVNVASSGNLTVMDLSMHATRGIYVASGGSFMITSSSSSIVTTPIISSDSGYVVEIASGGLFNFDNGKLVSSVQGVFSVNTINLTIRDGAHIEFSGSYEAYLVADSASSDSYIDIDKVSTNITSNSVSNGAGNYIINIELKEKITDGTAQLLNEDGSLIVGCEIVDSGNSLRCASDLNKFFNSSDYLYNATYEEGLILKYATSNGMQVLRDQIITTTKVSNRQDISTSYASNSNYELISDNELILVNRFNGSVNVVGVENMYKAIFGNQVSSVITNMSALSSSTILSTSTGTCGDAGCILSVTTFTPSLSVSSGKPLPISVEIPVIVYDYAPKTNDTSTTSLSNEVNCEYGSDCEVTNLLFSDYMGKTVTDVQTVITLNNNVVKSIDTTVVGKYVVTTVAKDDRGYVSGTVVREYNVLQNIKPVVALPAEIVVPQPVVTYTPVEVAPVSAPIETVKTETNITRTATQKTNVVHTVNNGSHQQAITTKTIVVKKYFKVVKRIACTVLGVSALAKSTPITRKRRLNL